MDNNIRCKGVHVKHSFIPSQLTNQKLKSSKSHAILIQTRKYFKLDSRFCWNDNFRSDIPNLIENLTNI